MGWGKFTGKLFGRQIAENEELNIEAVRAARAVYQGTDLKDRITIQLKIEGEGVLTLSMPPELVHKLVREAGSAYEASNPRLYQGGSFADWEGQQL